MSFRVGRKSAQHSYPTSPGAAGGAAAFARNFAQGPSVDTAVADGAGTQIPWAFIESGAAPGVHVPITPQVTGRVRIVGVFAIVSVDEASVNIHFTVQIDDVTHATPVVSATVPASGLATVPFLVDIPVLPVGTTSNISILATASDSPGLSLAELSSTLDIQELPAATG